ncbi:MAG: Flp pilus assembly complex ATPase component TadA [Candidatus Omnitrophica bacterium]|nr:Flp pilus assembly complex ATPase component TadA [Candidatus Omnitrophota bacterium]
MKHLDKVLKDALTANHILSEQDAARYLTEAHLQHVAFKDYLLRNDIVNERQIVIALSQTLDIPLIDFRKLKVLDSLIEKIPVKFVWYYKFMPVAMEGNTLLIAAADPLGVKILDEIRLHLGFPIKQGLVTESELMDALKKYYGLASDTIDRIISGRKGNLEDKAEIVSSSSWVEDLEHKTEDPTVAQLVNEIILEAYKKRATDIHIEPYRDKVRFRYRIDGVLADANLPDKVKHFLPQILSRIKILANLSITEKRLPQDGSAVVKTKEQQLDLRISTMPTPRGESIVVRILPSKVMLFSLEKLGFVDEGVNKFRELVKKPHGIIFITGPTGSGKTTTLYACLNEINSAQRKIITIEDPVEYEMEGITQIQVNNKINFDFSIGLRSILRHDPDIIMVGEVRDLETAEIAVRTALTGHLVFSTLHTNDAASGVSRLIDMGIEPYLLISSVEAFIAQRLVRVICPKCRVEMDNVPNDIKEEMIHSLNLDPSKMVSVFQGKGCEYCNNTGYYGRTAIHEILEIKDAMRSAILNKARADQLKTLAMEEGMVTLRQNGWKAVLNGITTPSEVLNVTVRDNQFNQGSDKLMAVAQNPPSWKVKRQESWEEQNSYDSRVYPRIFENVEVRYHLLNKDPENPHKLISDGVEYKTYTEDISAGGLRFCSKTMLQLDSIIGLTIYLIKENRTINCLAKVCRIEEDSRDHFYTVVNYYLDLTSADRAALSRYVKTKLQELFEKA